MPPAGWHPLAEPTRPYTSRAQHRVHEKLPNPTGWRGTELSVTISGAWSTYVPGWFLASMLPLQHRRGPTRPAAFVAARYKPRIVAYLTQLAMITPYAQLGLRCADSRTPPATDEATCSTSATRVAHSPIRSACTATQARSRRVTTSACGLRGGPRRCRSHPKRRSTILRRSTT